MESLVGKATWFHLCLFSVPIAFIEIGWENIDSRVVTKCCRV